MPPPRTWRRSAWPIYPGILAQYVVAMIMYAAALSGFRLPLNVHLLVQIALEGLVLLFVWRAIKATRAARKAILRLFSAQTNLSYAVLLQAFILLLPH
jgi:hypothetical protein